MPYFSCKNLPVKVQVVAVIEMATPLAFAVSGSCRSSGSGDAVLSLGATGDPAAMFQGRSNVSTS